MRIPFWTIAVAIPTAVVAAAVVFAPSSAAEAPAALPTVAVAAPTATLDPAADVVPAAAATPGKTCHTAYTVGAHDVGEHTVKATAKHSAYVVKAHHVAEHTVKANC